MFHFHFPKTIPRFYSSPRYPSHLYCLGLAQWEHKPPDRAELLASLGFEKAVGGWGHAARADRSSRGVDPRSGPDSGGVRTGAREHDKRVNLDYPVTGIEFIPPESVAAMLQAIVAAYRAPPRGCSPCPSGKSSGPSGPSRPGGEVKGRQTLVNSNLNRVYRPSQVGLYGIPHMHMPLHMRMRMQQTLRT